ncbi:hypothetical protein D3C76_815020 [compost metagenome]
MLNHFSTGQNRLTLALGQLQCLFLKLVREVQQFDQVALAEQFKLLGGLGLVVAQQCLAHADQLLHGLASAFARFFITAWGHFCSFEPGYLTLVSAGVPLGEALQEVGVEHDRHGLAVQTQTVAQVEQAVAQQVAQFHQFVVQRWSEMVWGGLFQRRRIGRGARQVLGQQADQAQGLVVALRGGLQCGQGELAVEFVALALPVFHHEQVQRFAVTLGLGIGDQVGIVRSVVVAVGAHVT